MEFKPPQNIAKRDPSKKTIFLAGTIDQGESIDWQKEASEKLSPYFEIFNPRRDGWDKTWIQHHENPQFSQQVLWELNALEKCDIIIMNLLPGSMSLISLFELGLHTKSKKVYVVCTEGFHRGGNVYLSCDFYGVPLFDTLDSLIDFIIKNLK